MLSATPACADILGNFQAFEAGRSSELQERAPRSRDLLGTEVAPWCKGEKPEHGQLGQEQFMISSIRMAIPDPTSVLSTGGQRTVCTRLGSDRCGTPSTAQLGIATSKATSGQLQDQIAIFPRALLALDGPEHPHLGPTAHPWAQEVI